MNESRLPLTNRFLREYPRWVVLLIDLVIVWTTFVFSFVLIAQFRTELSLEEMMSQSLLALTVYFLSFIIFQPFRSIIRRTELRDLFVISKCITAAFAVLFVSTTVAGMLAGTSGNQSFPPFLQHLLDTSQIQLLLHAMMACAAMLAARFVYKAWYHSRYWTTKGNQISVVLFGAGDMGNSAFNLLHAGSRNRYRVVAIVDDNPTRIGKRIQGIPVRPLDELDMNFLKRVGGAQELIIAIDNHDPERLERISVQAEPLPLKIKIIPNSTRMLEGSVATRQIRTLKINDLLGRKAIELNNPVVYEAMHGKVVLVTGGAGSIGSELVRQIIRTGCQQLVVLDQAESPLYEIQQELHREHLADKAVFVVGDVRDYGFTEAIFEAHRPQVVFHAAAYKHVPLMEVNPYEAILTNVVGSCNVADLAHKYGVEKFVMISTDKAVNPTNVMGATKRIAEIYVSALNNESETAFVVTRFGNVLGSNGSVIPLFEKQIKAGGPMTLTHPDITRYFMTIPEACQLVQEAGVMGRGGEVFVFDMGKPVRIMDLAQKMIRLKGLSYPDDIDIKIVGLRPGEKISEELLANDENTLRTYHDKILIAKVNTHDLDEKAAQIRELCAFVTKAEPYADRVRLVALVKDIVPEYVSNNSEFGTLDAPRQQHG